MATVVKSIELVHWDKIKEDCGLSPENNNDGEVFGLHYIDVVGEGDILDTDWFKTEKERSEFIEKNELKILDEY